LDQGIIRIWKAYYRKRWLTWLINNFENGEDPYNKMNVLQAIRWGIEAWHTNITTTTIANYWLKAKVLAPQMIPSRCNAEPSIWAQAVTEDEAVTQEVRDALYASLQTLERTKRVHEAITINELLSPTDEIVTDDPNEEGMLD